MEKKYIDEIIQQVNNEYDVGKAFAANKRTLIRERLAAYRNITNSKKKIYDRLIRSIVKTRLSIHYNDKKTVSFMGRQGKVGAEHKARLIDALAQFDFDEMGGPKKEYRHLEDVAIKGVGIKVGGFRDDVTSTPEYRVIDPLCWVPDPHCDVNSGPRFHGFELEIGRAELHAGGFAEITEVKSKTEQAVDKYIAKQVHAGSSLHEVENDAWVIENRELARVEKSIKGNELYKVYVHFTQVNNKKYMFTLANDRTLLIGQKEIEAVREEEKKDTRKIPFPVVVTNLSPIQDDPYGESFFDILEDKQVARQTFLNLRLIKARHEVMGDKYLVNSKVFKNVSALSRVSEKTSYILADLDKDPNPIRPIDKPQIRQDSYNMPELLEQQAMQESNIDQGSMGVATPGSQTNGEHRRLQMNTNLRMILDRKMLLLGEKEFWDILWFRVYQENFKSAKKKQILINSGLGKIPQPIGPDDFATLGDVSVSIESDMEKREREEKNTAGFMANIGTFLENSKSEFARNFAMRKLARASGMSEEEAYVIAPETFDEMNAKLDLALVNRDEDAAPVEAGQDHMTYIAILDAAHNTPAKMRAIAARRMALFEEKRMEATNPNPDVMPAGPTANQNQGMLMSQMMSQENSQEQPSLQDISANG